MRLVVEHVLLLLVKFAYGLDKSLLTLCELASGFDVAVDVPQVAQHIAEFLADELPHFVCGALLGLGHRKVLLASYTPVCPGLAKGMRFLVETVDDFLKLLAGRVQKLEVLWVLYVGRGACRVKNSSAGVGHCIAIGSGGSL